MARKELSALNVIETPATPVVEPARPTGLRVEHIARSFGQRQVVRDVSLHVERGQVAGLLGPNGAGKTTCFYMITGLIPPDSGTIWLDGEDITAQPMYQRARMGLGYLAQEASIFRGMTVEHNVMAVVELHHTGRAAIAEETSRLLEELRIDHLRHAPASGLSGGERRRCEIARALAGKPSFMLLDEPFAGIDPLAIADIRQVIRYLAGQGIGVLITDHNVRETLEIIDHASIISGGSVLFEGKAEDVIRDPEVRRVYLGDMYG
ncbi:ABC transporter ATP-binding protein [Brevundimonas denitrificans]|uniref:Lipopolysaccharide export system ATP-binding protein LptB n=1 Tax=Brevundimonas denitrificans TaxID=1443434 RepID=A0ABQ6BK22_9CAUL|nr:ABC transporter ATP-binding protein [Brevundimonas denitrificans]